MSNKPARRGVTPVHSELPTTTTTRTEPTTTRTEPTKKVTVDIPLEMHTKLFMIRAHTGDSLQKVINRAIASYLEAQYSEDLSGTS